jgi:hypothetical protein
MTIVSTTAVRLYKDTQCLFPAARNVMHARPGVLRLNTTCYCRSKRCTPCAHYAHDSSLAFVRGHMGQRAHNARGRHQSIGPSSNGIPGTSGTTLDNGPAVHQIGVEPTCCWHCITHSMDTLLCSHIAAALHGWNVALSKPHKKGAHLSTRATQLICELSVYDKNRIDAYTDAVAATHSAYHRTARKQGLWDEH